MISRRLIRIKAMQVLYAGYKTDDGKIANVQKELFESFDKTYELYFLLMQLLISLKDYAQNRIEQAKNKYIPTEEDLHPNTQFIDNAALRVIENTDVLFDFAEKKKLSWHNDEKLISNLYKAVVESETYKKYLNAEETGPAKDKEFLIEMLAEVISEFEPLPSALEERSIYWVQDMEFVLGIMIKSIERLRFSENAKLQIPPMFKDEDDRKFAENLIKKSILNREKTKELITKYSRNWEIERIAFIDTIIIQMAVSEFMDFPTIPVKVTMNEYIDIARFFSTPKSSTFVNGILDNIVHELQKTKLINKSGRGLKGNN